jgi:hypothetical protein
MILRKNFKRWRRATRGGYTNIQAVALKEGAITAIQASRERRLVGLAAAQES